MREIASKKDLAALRQAGDLPEQYLDFLDSEFGLLAEALGGDQPGESFSLKRHGLFVVLERGDNLGNLAAVGLEKGLPGCWPEYVEVAELSGMLVYKVAVLFTNEFMALFYSEVGIHDAQAEAWMAEQCE